MSKRNLPAGLRCYPRSPQSMSFDLDGYYLGNVRYTSPGAWEVCEPGFYGCWRGPHKTKAEAIRKLISLREGGG